MREKDNLMNWLNQLPSEEEPLTEAEMKRLTQQVLQRTGCKKPAKRRGRLLHSWSVGGKVLVGGVACAALLVGINGVNPVLAEGLPILGDVFAYINGLPKGYLQSDQLSVYAQSAQVGAESNAPQDSGAAAAPALQREGGDEQPYKLTLTQIYCDEMYLRLGLTLTAEDDALAGFDGVTLDPPLLWEDTTAEEANTLYGGVTLNGEAIGGDLLPYFRKQDDTTFVCEMDYNLQNYTGDTQNVQASLTFSNLVGVCEGSEETTPLEGTYHIDFTVSADETLTREGQIDGGVQNGIRLESLEATPGETRIQYTVTSMSDKTELYPQIFMEDGSNLEWVKGTPEEQTESGETVWAYYFDAVPEGAKTLTVRILDKSAEEEAVLAQWTVTLF